MYCASLGRFSEGDKIGELFESEQDAYLAALDALNGRKRPEDVFNVDDFNHELKVSVIYVQKNEDTLLEGIKSLDSISILEELNESLNDDIDLFYFLSGRDIEYLNLSIK